MLLQGADRMGAAVFATTCRWHRASHHRHLCKIRTAHFRMGTTSILRQVVLVSKGA